MRKDYNAKGCLIKIYQYVVGKYTFSGFHLTTNYLGLTILMIICNKTRSSRIFFKVLTISISLLLNVTSRNLPLFSLEENGVRN